MVYLLRFTFGREDLCPLKLRWREIEAVDKERAASYLVKQLAALPYRRWTARHRGNSGQEALTKAKNEGSKK